MYRLLYSAETKKCNVMLQRNGSEGMESVGGQLLLMDV